MAIILKCKMCGGDLTLEPNSNLATCEYCGTTQTVPALADDKMTRLYNRANQYRMDSEFDKAYTAYESIVNDKPDEAEAYWGMLLSEYGVEYVDDPKTGKKIPTCHRTLVRAVKASPNYKAAYQNADAECRMMYEDDAAVLDALQKRVLNASAKEEPYDVFICYKESDKNGERTQDSVMAQDIYDALTAKGMRVFFSRISLEDKLGQDYEPCIFAALNSAKVMLMVTTDSDHCESVWVKNEWKRYLDFMNGDPKKTLIPVYKDISPYTLPEEFTRFQAQDMGKLGAIQDLVRGVEKLTGKNQKTGGLSQKEKEEFSSLKKTQQLIRFALFCGLGAVLWYVVTYVTIWNLDWDWYVFTQAGEKIALNKPFAMNGPEVIAGWVYVLGIAPYFAYGRKNIFSAIMAVLLTLACAVIIVLAVIAGYAPTLLALVFAGAAIGMLLASFVGRKRK